MTLDLSGQTALVTGASRGIGRAIARALAKAGATVAVHFARSVDAADAVADACGNGSQTFQADLSDLDATDGLIDEVTERLGGLDVLINNAGVAQSAPLDASTSNWNEAWTRTMAVNLRAPELLCRHAIRHFQARGGGRIINIASRAAHRGDTPDYMAYAASKAGVVALTKSVARGFGEDNIKAFAVAPGFTRTDMAQDFIDTYGEDYATHDLALSELTEPEDVAPTVVFLASGNADHATGTTIDINAGSYVH
ncbi:MAG: SDR family oxidoreductase [Bacteroidetes bacterium]|jgi:NAD(P)-dependent dehydrogenase (short-subunit alcohol dehydrogenase family)|nr:SDR family oxidoreductase [Bacteroidota bacterium]